MAEKIFFSVVIPAFNRGRWVGEAVSSALGQGRDDCEVIVVDDGSTDNTLRVLEGFAGRARIVRQENTGVSAARNHGIEEAKGEWIAFLDADDRWRPGHLDRLFRIITDRPGIGLVFTDAMAIDEAGRELKFKLSPDPGPDPFVSLLLANTITTSAAAVRRSCFERAGLFLPGLKSGQDWDIWLRVARYYPVAHAPVISIDYRRQQGGTVHTRGVAMRDDNLFIVSRAAALAPALSDRVLRRARANCYLESAVRLLVAGAAGEARKELVSALREYPALPPAWALLPVALAGPGAARAAVRWRRFLEPGS